MKVQSPERTFMISGGGTGGHIFPALAIAGGLQAALPCKIVFVGAKGRMEMEKVPEAGYPIHGLWISGLQRKLTFSNALFPLKVLVSLVQAFFLLRKYKPDAVIGVGGYASGPLLYVATILGIKTIIQEQNSFPGITNKLLGKRVNKILTAFKGPEKYLPASKIVETGNPVRKDILTAESSVKSAREFFGLEADKPVLLVIGGSLGARTLNECLEKGHQTLAQNGIQVLWQTGKQYTGNANPALGVRMPFIREMDKAYAAADVIVSRAGALSISELCIVGKPVILVPSPNVSEDHQTKNAMTLVNANAAMLIADKDAADQLVPAVISLFGQPVLCDQMAVEIKKLGKPEATHHIVSEILALLT